MPSQSVHTCVTSPPYWGLRDYGHAGQLGLESTPDEYVSSMVAVFREVGRVLREDGTVWLNLGDSYAGGGNYRGMNSESTLAPKQASNRGARGLSQQLGAAGKDTGLQSKNLCGIPWRVAFALQADGWYLRSDIIWSKPNPMPESVTDRPTKSHEYIFLLSKRERYYYDAAAIAEPASQSMLDQIAAGYDGTATKDFVGNGVQDASAVKSRILRRFNGSTAAKSGAGGDRNDGGRCGVPIESVNRNKRSVWTVTTKPYSGAHFATFPPDLIEPCILAGCPERCCSECGAPWVRQIELGEIQSTGGSVNNRRNGHTNFGGSDMNCGEFTQRAHVTTGWQPSCQCNAGTVPGTVLDCFGGAGTTGLVADRLQRNAILIELNPTYADMARNRVTNDCPLFTVVNAGEVPAVEVVL